MNSKNILYSIVATVVLSGFILNKKIGEFDMTTDIGNPKIVGSSDYDKNTKTYTLKGSGYNIWFERDEFQFLYKEQRLLLITLSFLLIWALPLLP